MRHGASCPARRSDGPAMGLSPSALPQPAIGSGHKSRIKTDRGEPGSWSSVKGMGASAGGGRPPPGGGPPPPRPRGGPARPLPRRGFLLRGQPSPPPPPPRPPPPPHPAD